MTKAELIETVQRGNKNLTKRATAEVIDSTFSALAKAPSKKMGGLPILGLGPSR